MLRDDEKLNREKEKSSKQAITLAVQGRWREAVEANKQMLEQFPRDVDAYNRLGRAYMELGEFQQAKEAYNRAVEFDPYNAIAKKNLQRLSYLKEAEASAEAQSHGVEPHQFIEEMGKAGVVNLYNLAPKETRAVVVAGDNVNLRVEGTNLAAENSQGDYLGRVDPKHTLRLLKLMDGGNKYTAAVVSSDENALTIIIREVYQHPSQAGRLSFPPKGLEEVRPYVSDRVPREVEAEEEGEESGYTIVGGEEVEVLAEEDDYEEEDMSGEEE